MKSSNDSIGNRIRDLPACTAAGGNKIMFEISTSWSTLAASSSKPILRFILVFSNTENQFPSHIQPEMLEARSLSDAVGQYAANPCGSSHITNSITCIRFQVLKAVSLLQCDCVLSGGLIFQGFWRRNQQVIPKPSSMSSQTKGSEF